MRTTLFYLFLLFLPAPAQAELWYQVEVIIFDRLDPDPGGEQWRAAPFSLPARRVELQAADPAADEARIPYSLLPPERQRLGGIYNMFRRSAEYRPLLHLSWQQPAATGRQAGYVRLQHPKPAATARAAEPAFIEELLPAERIIDGVIRIRSGFYLHADIDLSYFSQIAPADEIDRAEAATAFGAMQTTPIPLKETRQIKLNEIHYFDHPLYGVILQVSRLN